MFQQTIPTRLLVPRRETDFEGPRGPKWVRYSKEEEERLAQDCLCGEREARNTYVYRDRLKGGNRRGLLLEAPLDLFLKIEGQQEERNITERKITNG